MTTSQIITLSKPTGADRIPSAHFEYMRTRNKRRLYTLVMDEFIKSGISQADLARRLGRNPDVVCRWLRAPGNWQVNTVSDLLFAISGAEAAYSVYYPFDALPQNYTMPEWLIGDDLSTKEKDLTAQKNQDNEVNAATSSSNTRLVSSLDPLQK